MICIVAGHVAIFINFYGIHSADSLGLWIDTVQKWDNGFFIRNRDIEAFKGAMVGEPYFQAVKRRYINIFISVVKTFPLKFLGKKFFGERIVNVAS